MGNSQYNRLGALNNIIMVYPDTRCWNNDQDPDGIDEFNWNKKTGILPAAIKAMIDRVTGASTEDDDNSPDDEDDFSDDEEEDDFSDDEDEDDFSEDEEEDEEDDFSEEEVDDDESVTDLAVWLED